MSIENWTRPQPGLFRGLLAEGSQGPTIDLLGRSSGTRNIAGLGKTAAADSAVLAIFTMRPSVVKRTAVRKLLLAAATLNGIMPLINGLTPDDIIAFFNTPISDVHPKLT